MTKKEDREKEQIREVVNITKKRAAVFYRAKISSLYEHIGAEKDECRFCSRSIWWVPSEKNKMSPYTSDGIPHYDECPER